MFDTDWQIKRIKDKILKKCLENRTGGEKRRSLSMGAKLFAHWMVSEGCLTHKNNKITGPEYVPDLDLHTTCFVLYYFFQDRKIALFSAFLNL